MNFDELFPDERSTGNTVIRQCQLVMLRMLKIVDYLCKRHSVKYFLIGGTLLGAVRHKGFIPWDDDLDIGMTKDSYEKFVTIIVPLLPNDIFFQCNQTDHFYSTTNFVDAKLRDKYSSYTYLDGIKRKWHEGLQIDIFIFNKAYFPNKLLIISQNIFLNKIVRSQNKKRKIINYLQNSNLFNFVYCNNWLQSYGMMKFGINYFREDELQQLTEIEFEDMVATIPVGWHAQLVRQYGNYMKLPDEHKRFSHHDVIANPFITCDHAEVLNWDERISNNKQKKSTID